MADQDTLSPEKERQILDGAGRVFALDGYEGASMSRIAAEASVSKGTLYNYFSGKADLFGAFVRRECTSGVTLLFDEIDESVPPEEMLTRIGRQLVAMLTSETGLVRQASFPNWRRRSTARGRSVLWPAWHPGSPAWWKPAGSR
jgi:TetR/AcrR family transcriptional repressor of mexJK operon